MTATSIRGNAHRREMERQGFSFHTSNAAHHDNCACDRCRTGANVETVTTEEFTAAIRAIAADEVRKATANMAPAAHSAHELHGFIEDKAAESMFVGNLRKDWQWPEPQSFDDDDDRPRRAKPVANAGDDLGLYVPNIRPWPAR